jgi:P-type Ca2+ transporter type 2C
MMPQVIQDDWHALSLEQIAKSFEVNALSGLSQNEAQRRQDHYGLNRLAAGKTETFWSTFLEEIREPMILLLLITGVLYAIWGNFADTVTIFVVILALVAAEVVNEHRAKQAIAALAKLAEPTTPVRRDGRRMEIRADHIVPGDVLFLETGRRIAADARLVEAYGLAMDESALTGESASIEKDTERVLPESTPVADRSNMVFSGTTVVRGRGTAIVVATGMQTELGRTATIAREVVVPRTPLQNLMRGLTKSLAWLAIGFSVLVPLLGSILSHQPLRLMIVTGLAMAFSVIPEELPIIVTMVLALGAYRLSKKKAIVKHLQTVETLGAITLIAADKTGTLTQHRMEVRAFYPEQFKPDILKIGVICNDAAADGSRDPVDVALFEAAQANGISRPGPAGFRLRGESTFDNVRKRMSVVYAEDGHLVMDVKGAPETVLMKCAARWNGTAAQPLTQLDRQNILAHADHMANEGMRVLSFAEKNIEEVSQSQIEAEPSLTFVGLAGLADPPRPEARKAIASCRSAGIRPIMITGDHPLTAQAVAKQIGLEEAGRVISGGDLDHMSLEALKEAVRKDSVFARTTPEHKLRIVGALQEGGEIVAVTGDGINDAPALAAADIGIAMGETGTDVARESADMILADDNFATIVGAIEEGRISFENLKNAFRYYLACKIALVSAMLLPVLLALPVPFAPVQIIVMELFMDLAASAAFVAEPAERDLMQRPPRNPKAKFLDRPMMASISSFAASLFAVVSICYLTTWYRSHDLATAQTMAFAAWLMGHICLAFNLRSEREPLVRLGFFSNRMMTIWGAATVALLLFAILVPSLRNVFKVAELSGSDWLLVIGSALIGTFWIEMKKLLNIRRDHHPLAA